MSALSVSEQKKIINAANRLAFNARSESIERFVTRTLNLNPTQQVKYFPGGQLASPTSEIISYFTRERERLLRDEGKVPQFVVWSDSAGNTFIGGTGTFLGNLGADYSLLRRRLPEAPRIRATLKNLRQGHSLEAIAAAIVDSSIGNGSATKGSGDQGIDAIGWHILLPIQQSFVDGYASANNTPREKVFILASSKAQSGQDHKNKLIDPAFIRELVGGWLIQRSPVGVWNQEGITFLSPVQLVLVTTYRLSASAKQVCIDLGIQVWGIAELTYLICTYAPMQVFTTNTNPQFDPATFRSWWRPYHINRLIPK